MDRYEARIKLFGSTQRERNVNKLKQSIWAKLPDNPSYKSVKINDKERFLCINTGTQPYYKEFETLPNEDINIGDYVDFANSKWIVVTCDSDNEIYRDGKLYQCNYLLKWQNDIGEIIERWAFIASASKYNDGTTGNNVITLGSDQLSVVIPLDEESLRLKKNQSRKFFIDNNKTNPTTYELTGTGNVPDTYDGHGVTSWIVKECEYTPTTDDLKYGVCNYHSTLSISDISTEEMTVSIVGSDIIKIGKTKTWTVKFRDRNGNDLEYLDWKWNIKSDFDISELVIQESGSDIKITTQDDDSLVNGYFLLQILKNDETVITEKQINIGEIY